MLHSGNSYANGLIDRNSYQGKTKEQGLNRIDLGFRSFNPTTGIFDRSDPLAEMTPDFSPFSYTLNNPVNFIDEFGLMGSGWNTRGREKTEAETANQEQMDNPTIKRVEITQNAGAMANIPDGGSKGWYKSPEVGQKVMDADNSVFDYAISIVFGKDYTDNFGFQYNVGFDGRIKGYKPISGNAPDLGFGKVKAIAPLAKKLPMQIHHFATNKNSTFTKLFTKITDKYKLDLNGTWNKMKLPHQGRHPNKYHQFVLKHMGDAQNYAGKSTKKFLQYFNENVVKPVQDFPELLRKSGWND